MSYAEKLSSVQYDIHYNKPVPLPRIEEITVSSTEKQRCLKCNKKLPLTAFTCKCTHYFCAGHRPPEEHACKYNYKQEGQQLLVQINQGAVADKIQFRI